MKLRNRIIILYQIILFFLFNLVLFFAIDFLIRQVPFFNIPGNKYLAFLVITVFWALLIFVNVKFIFPLLKKKIKRIISKYLLRSKKRRKLNKYVIITIILFSIFLFQFWNIDFLFQKYSSPVTSLINSKRKYIIEFVDKVDYSGIKSVQVDPEKIRNVPEGSDYGRFLRTYRWSPFIEKAEKAYGIEKGLLAGLIMQESFGNPLELNSGNDGGAGLMMFQPGTAKAYGLKTFGRSSATGRDKIHGLAMKNLVEIHKYNYEKLSVLDERFHVGESIDAGAKFLNELHKRYQSWDNAISAYNRGTPAVIPQSTKHVRMVRHFQKQYLYHYNRVEK